MNPPVRREAEQLRSRELLAHDYLTTLVQRYQVKARFAEINADCAQTYLNHDKSAVPNGFSFNRMLRGLHDGRKLFNCHGRSECS